MRSPFGIEFNTALLIGGGVVLAAFLARRAVASTVDALNPTNPDNVFAGAVNSVVVGVTGDSAQTLGGSFFDAIQGSRCRAVLREPEAYDNATRAICSQEVDSAFARGEITNAERQIAQQRLGF